MKRLFNWLLAAAFVASLYGVIQYLDGMFFPPPPEPGLDPFIWRGAFGRRIFSTFGNPNFFGDFLKDYIVKKNKKKITTRMLLPKDAAGLHLEIKNNDKNDLRETRFLNEHTYNPNGNIAIWENNVSFISWDKEFHVIVVKDKYFAEMMRMIFNSLWG